MPFTSVQVQLDGSWREGETGERCSSFGTLARLLAQQRDDARRGPAIDPAFGRYLVFDTNGDYACTDDDGVVRFASPGVADAMGSARVWAMRRPRGRASLRSSVSRCGCCPSAGRDRELPGNLATYATRRPQASPIVNLGPRRARIGRRVRLPERSRSRTEARQG